ncbi:MAG: sensor histidine kinase [Magnetovibrionaceae bacterium]
MAEKCQQPDQQAAGRGLAERLRRFTRRSHGLTGVSNFKKPTGFFAPRNRWATRYLVFSLAAALIPIVILSALYDTYFSDLVTKVSESENDAQLAAYGNAAKHFLQERDFELDDLIDQIDQPSSFTQSEWLVIPTELETILRVLTDTPHIYGIVFFDHAGAISRTFPSDLQIPTDVTSLPSTPWNQSQILGPSTPTVDRPSWFILRKDVPSGGGQAGSGESLIGEAGRGVGLVLRFATLTEFMGRISIPGLLEPALKVQDGTFYDPVGLVIPSERRTEFHSALDILPGWQLRVRNEAIRVVEPLVQVRYFLLLAAIFTAMAVIYLHYDISYRINSQIESLIKRVERVAHGRTETKLNVGGNWEIRRLGAAIDLMRTQLQKYMRNNLEMERRASLGKLAAGVAHEIRNPLATINTAVRALQKSEADPERLDLMGIVGNEIDRANVIIASMLDYARPRTPEPQQLNVKDLFGSVQVLIEASARQHGLTVDVDLTPPPEGDLFIFGDPVHIKQALMNLVLNGLQAMEDRKKGTLHLIAYEQKPFCILKVRDEGCGIAPDHVERITEPFFTTKTGGTGLGLAISASLITTNGGQLRIESELGVGTTIVVSLPIRSQEKQGTPE